MNDRPWPWRMLVRGVFQTAWFTAQQEEKNRVFGEWIDAHRRWSERGCRFLATLDDELNLVGAAPPGRANFYSLWEVPSPDATYDLLNDFRVQEPEKTRLDAYFRIETIVGKPIVGLERGLGGPQSATGPLREGHGG